MLRRTLRAGFALPTVVIVGTVLFAVMVVTLGSAASVRTVLDTQYYEALARDAAESGIKHAEACLDDATFKGGAVSITPATNCAGVVQSGGSAYIINQSSGAPRYRTTYTARMTQATAESKIVVVDGTTQLVQTSTGVSWKDYTKRSHLQATNKIDPVGDRASKRNWYFGNNGRLDFGANGNAMPVALAPPGGMAFSIEEGSTVVNDMYGNLQFFSNGLTVWDKTGAVMADQTGDPNPMNGASSATQGAAVFPLDVKRTRYAVISNTGQAQTGLGELYLNIIDMTRNSGNGAVISKNIMLGTGKGLGIPNSYNGNNPDKSYSAEALGAVPKVGGGGYYVYTYSPTPGREKIIGFLVKTDGSIDPTPTTWALNPLPRRCQLGTGLNVPTNHGTYGFGSINFSGDYTKMLVLVGAFACSKSSTTPSGTIYYMNLDPTTGAVSLNVSWETATVATTGDHDGYTADLSPAERYVYVTHKFPGSLVRYDLNAGSSSGIKATQSIVSTIMTNRTSPSVSLANDRSGGQVRRGPDGRMYIADNAYLADDDGSTYPQLGTAGYISYIANPDAAGATPAAIGLAIDGIQLAPGSFSGQGMPQMATVYNQQYSIY